MANFLLTYYGGGMPETKEEQARVMQAWTAWFGELGDALVDGGNPTSQSRAISPDGSVMDATSEPSGYSIIKADGLDAAVTAASRAALSSPAAQQSSSRRRSPRCSSSERRRGDLVDIGGSPLPDVARRPGGALRRRGLLPSAGHGPGRPARRLCLGRAASHGLRARPEPRASTTLGSSGPHAPMAPMRSSCCSTWSHAT